jgi:membrane fusion protein (multidrug efflux system)
MADQAATLHSDDTLIVEEEPRSGRNRRVGLIVLGVLLIAAAIGAIWFWRYETEGKYFQSTDNAYIQSDSVIVSPKIAGYVERVLVEENQTVHAGQPLVEIDPREYRAQASQIEAQIEVARASAQGVRAQIREQQASVEQARAQVAAAESALSFARSEIERYTPLAESGAEPRERLSQLRNEERQAVAQLAGARAALLSAQRRTGTLEAQVEQAESQARASQAQLEAANVNLGSTILSAPVAGRVASKSAQQGQLVQPGARLMSVVPVDKLYIEANFKETQLALMRVGQPVTVEVDALDGVELHGRVESVSPGTGAEFSILPPQNATGNFTKIVQRVPVRISLDAGPSARRLLVPGMSVEVTVDTRSAREERERIEQEEAARERPARSTQQAGQKAGQ